MTSGEGRYTVRIQEDIRLLNPGQRETVSAAKPLGIYRQGFLHKKESLQFFKECVGEEVYSKAMNSEAGHSHHYAVARAFLNQSDWEKFVWIEEHGSLEGFPG